MRSPKIGQLPEHIPQRASSVDLIRAKIDMWNLHTDNLDMPCSPATTANRPISDLGPRSPIYCHIPESCRREISSTRTQGSDMTTFGLTLHAPRVFIGRPSDDVFEDMEDTRASCHVLKRVPGMEMVNSESDLSKYIGKTAPGGAEWI